QKGGLQREAFRYVAQRRPLVLLVFLAGALAFFGWPVLSLLPAVADQHLGTGQDGYAWLLSGLGGGALLGALLVATFGSARRPMLLGAGVLVGAGSIAGLAVSKALLPAVVCCALAGGGLILFFATAQAAMQLGADEQNRGRVLGVWLMVLSGA